MRIKQKIAIIFSLFLLFFAVSLVAADTSASSYPSIGGITIDSNTTAAQYIVYIVYLLMAVGAFAAVVVIIMAGIILLTSAGNPGALSEAKGKIKNALFGLVILFGSYLILSFINADLLTVKVTGFTCNQGIQIKTGDGQTDCITGTMATIPYDIASTIKWFVGTDTLYKVYIYPQTNFSGTPTEVKVGSGSIAGAKSIYFVQKSLGLYLFNGQGYTPGNLPYPIHISGTVDDLSTYGIDNMINSLDIVNSSDNSSFYHAVVFSDPKERGTCSFVGGQPVPNLGQAISGYYPTPIGNDTLSSVIVFQMDQSTKYKGSVFLYNVANCGAESTANSHKYYSLGDLISDQKALNCSSSAPGASWGGSSCVCPSGFSNPTVSTSAGSYVNTDICIQNNSSAASDSGMSTSTGTGDDTTSGGTGGTGGTTGGSSSDSSQTSTTTTDTPTSKLKSCEIAVPHSSGKNSHNAQTSPQNIIDTCGWDKGDNVVSLKITGSVGIVLVSDSGNCQYWDINSIGGDGTCVGSIIGESVYPNYTYIITNPITNTSVKIGSSPEKMMVFPVDKK